jgi:acyl carrier protein
MENETFLENFINILDNTERPPISLETSFRDIEGWDSLTALLLIAMADDEYYVKLTGDDIKNSVTVNDIFEKIKSKTN